jgi:katanin p60 ATPase-containing subunit A1
MTSEMSSSRLKIAADAKSAVERIISDSGNRANRGAKEESARVNLGSFIIIWVCGFPINFRYTEACERLQLESGVSLAKVQVADNIDLLNILLEFEQYYTIKFGKPPKLVRRAGSDGLARDS